MEGCNENTSHGEKTSVPVSEEKKKEATNNAEKVTTGKSENENAKAPADTSSKIRNWFDRQNWKTNPFVLNIIPSLFVGYENQKNELISCIEHRHKLCLVLGATGSGKTTALRWILDHVEQKDNFTALFISKPPATTKEFVDMFNREFFHVPWFLFFLKPLMPHIKNINSVPEVLNERFKDKHLVLLCDEVHEANVEVLQWMRVISDQVENMTIILSGLPVFDEMLRTSLETLQKRITTRIALSYLTKEETMQMISKRIEHVSKQGGGKNPFTDSAIEKIYKETGGFPREILRTCDRAVNKAISLGSDKIDAELVPTSYHEARRESGDFAMNEMPKRQKEIIDAIRQGKNTPSDIIGSIDMSKYKSESHAVRSVNNILQRLMKENLIERERHGKTFIYTLGPRLKSVAVRA